MSAETIALDKRPDGIVVLTITSGKGPHNTLDRAFNEHLLSVIEDLAADDSVKGVVVTSGKDSFAAGGDLDQLLAVRAPKDAEVIVAPFIRAIRRLESMGKPVVAALNGSALGGGYELALATHHRIAADRPDAQFGLPEAGLGLMPGGGGTQRLPRLIGLEAAGDMILMGKVMGVADARSAGLVDDVVPADKLIDAAADWALAHPDAVQPWDQRGWYSDAADPNTMAGRRWVQSRWAANRARAGKDDLSATTIIQTLHHGLERKFDAGAKIETREFTRLCATPTARAKMRTLFYGPKAGRPVADDETVAALKHLGVAGGGTMGNGIAFAAARAGMQVTLVEIDADRAKVAHERIEAIGARQVKRGRMTQDKLDTIMSRIATTADYADLAPVDFVIEAVFERLDVKHEVYGKLEAVLRPDVTIASNTSSILIGELAKGLSDPSRMIGMHFFAPVEVMKLLEIIRPEATSDKALDEALAVAKMMRKTQITVKDRKGFYTSRLVSSMTAETLNLLAEGVSPAVIDNVMKGMGFAIGPATLVDMTKIPLLRDIMDSMNGPGMPKSMEGNRALEVLDRLIEAGRESRDAGHGLYDYGEDGADVWPGLAELFPATDATPDPDTVRDRLMITQSLEAARCIDEALFDDPLAADIASVMGWGYPAHLGGPVGYVDVIGADELVARADDLAARYGARFAAPDSLRSMAASGGGYYENDTKEKAA